MTQPLPPKKEVALALLERSDVDIYLDPRATGVVVPPQFRKEPRLILKVGLNMPVPIPDLHVDDESMTCTLSFNRVKFFCVVPWPSVFAMVGDDGRGMVWPDDVPRELAVRVEEPRPQPTLRAVAPPPEEAKPAKATKAGKSTKAKSKARAQAEAAAPATESGEPAAPARPKRSRKKKEEPARPVLHAVPPPPKEPAPVDDLGARREAAAAAASTADRPQASPRPPSDPGRGPGRPPASSRPKRELPPYLRVVK